MRKHTPTMRAVPLVEVILILLLKVYVVHHV